MRRAALWFCLLPLAAAAQTPARIDLTTPEPRIILGRQVQLSATARASDGTVIPGAAITWSTDASGVVAVDARGMVTTVKLGMATVTARAGGATNSIEIQVVPLQVDVVPDRVTLLAGERFQFRAAAFDASGAAIGGVPFEWQVVGVHGGPTTAARMSPDGLLTTTSAAFLTVRATIRYTAVRPGSFAATVVATSAVEVSARREFDLGSLLSTEEERNSFELRPAYTTATFNDAGQIAFTASLDGLANGLFLFQGGRIDLLAAAGRPGPNPGTTISGFSLPSINGRGEVLVNVFGGGNLAAGGLLIASGAGLSWALLANASTGDVDNISGLVTSRYSLNDNSDILFRASYQLTGTTTTRIGLFQLSGERVQLLWSTDRALPGLAAATDFAEFGIDNQGVIYFVAVDAASRNLYRTDAATPPVKLFATDDSFDNSTINQVGTLAVSPAGPVAFRVILRNNAQHLVRIVGGQTQTLAVTGGNTVIGVSSGGAVLFVGNYRNQGQGLYRWQGDDVTLLLRQGAPTPNGQTIRVFDSAYVTPQGELYADVRTTTNDLVVLQPAAPAPLLLQAGQRVNVTANVTLAPVATIIPGHRPARPPVALGFPRSLFEFRGLSVFPRMLPGEPLPAGAFFTGIGVAFEDGAGNIYFVSNGALHRLAPEGVETLLPFTRAVEDGISLAGVNTNLFAVNERGAAVVDANTTAGHRRLYVLDGGALTLLAYNGTTSRWETPSPAGGVITGWTQLAIDELGRVMAFLNVRGGPSGYFLWADGRWQATALAGTTQVGGRTVAAASLGLRAVDDRFYTILNLGSPSLAGIAEFREQIWTPVIFPGHVMPTGDLLDYVRLFDVNRRGDVAYAAVTIGGGSRELIVVRSGDSSRLVHRGDQPIVGGTYLINARELDLRDDGYLYFTGWTLSDRYVLYAAEPLFPAPPRSRQ